MRKDDGQHSFSLWTYAVWASCAPILHIRFECGVLGIVYFRMGFTTTFF